MSINEFLYNIALDSIKQEMLDSSLHKEAEDTTIEGHTLKERLVADLGVPAVFTGVVNGVMSGRNFMRAQEASTINNFQREHRELIPFTQAGIRTQDLDNMAEVTNKLRKIDTRLHISDYNIIPHIKDDVPAHSVVELVPKLEVAKEFASDMYKSLPSKEKFGIKVDTILKPAIKGTALGGVIGLATAPLLAGDVYKALREKIEARLNQNKEQEKAASFEDLSLDKLIKTLPRSV